MLVRLKVDSIVDLMVEDRKVRYGVYVCSSEKADTHSRYVCNGFKMLALPTPASSFSACTATTTTTAAPPPAPG